MINFSSVTEKIEFYQKRFNEGTEIEDAVQLLLEAANILNGIKCNHELSLTILVAEKLMKDYFELCHNRELSWECYRYLDPELYSYLLGGAKKMTQEEYFYDNNWENQ